MIDFTQEIIDNIESDVEQQDFDIETKHGILIVSISIDDNREFIGPSYNSSDGLSKSISGDIDFEIESGLFTEDGEEIDLNYNINENKIYDFLNED